MLLSFRIAVVGILLLHPTLRAAPPQDINVVVIAILAADNCKKIDDKLKEIAAEIQKKDKTLTGFCIVETQKKTIPVGKSAKFVFAEVDKQEVDVAVNAKPNEKITLTIKPPTLGEINYSCKCNVYFPMITDYYTTTTKKRLIVAIMVHPCSLKKE